MFCQRCGKQISDNSKFCNFCGAQVAVISQSQQTSEYPQQNMYVVKQIDPEQNAKMLRIVISIIYGVLVLVVFSLTLFGKIFSDRDGSLIDLIGNEYFMEYSSAADPVGMMAICFILSGILMLLAITPKPSDESDRLLRTNMCGGGTLYLIGFLICVLNEYCDPSGLFFFASFLFVLTIIVCGLQMSTSTIETEGEATGTGLHAKAYPRHLVAIIPYSGGIPTDGDFDDLMNKSGLREHLLKTHPNNQLYLTVYQSAYSKFKEMMVSATETNRRIFDYTDSKNRIRFNLKYEKNKFDCEIHVNM